MDIWQRTPRAGILVLAFSARGREHHRWRWQFSMDAAVSLEGTAYGMHHRSVHLFKVQLPGDHPLDMTPICGVVDVRQFKFGHVVFRQKG